MTALPSKPIPVQFRPSASAKRKAQSPRNGGATVIVRQVLAQGWRFGADLELEPFYSHMSVTGVRAPLAAFLEAAMSDSLI